MRKKILVILGSVRPNRAGKKVADWVMKNAEARGAEYELADLKEIALPFMDEPVSPREAVSYIHEHTKNWSSIVAPADGFLFVTPEYNHGYPPALKNAVDYLYREWKGKPAGFIGYGGSGAQDSIRQMKEVLTRFRMRFPESGIGINKIWEAFDDAGNLKPELTSGDITTLLEEIENMT